MLRPVPSRRSASSPPEVLEVIPVAGSTAEIVAVPDARPRRYGSCRRRRSARRRSSGSLELIDDVLREVPGRTAGVVAGRGQALRSGRPGA